MKTKNLLYLLLFTCSISISATDLKWREINYNPQQDLRSVFAIGRDTAFIAGAQGAIFRTTDDAKSWSRTDIAGTPQLNSIRFATPKIGFAAGNGGVILKTTDGGDHWTSLNSGTSLTINALAIPKLSNMWAAGDSGLVIHSVDSGRTWVRVDTIVKNKENVFIAAYTSKKIEFYSNYSKPSLYEAICYMSENGGDSWSVNPYYIFQAEGISYMDDNVGYSVTVDFALGGSGGGGDFRLFNTSNAGKDWFEIPGYSPNGGAYGNVKTDIHISNDTTGYIVNKDLIVKILRRSDNLTPLKKIEYSPKVIITNLSRGVIRVKSNESPLLSAQVYNTGGSQVSVLQSKSVLNELTIDVSTLTPGVYIIRTRLQDGSVVQTKWVKR